MPYRGGQSLMTREKAVTASCSPLAPRKFHLFSRRFTDLIGPGRAISELAGLILDSSYAFNHGPPY
jgi:hypothetical protein